MYKFLIILALAVSITACNNDASTDTKVADSPSTTTPEVTKAPESTAGIKDSVMQFKDGKVLISVGGAWSDLSATVTTSNGRKVSPNGEVSKGKVTRKMEEGMMIDKDGQMMDKDGKQMDNTGWE